MRLDQMKLKWSPLRNIVITEAKSNRIHQSETGYKYNWIKWGLYKQTKLRIIYNDYVYAIYSMANPQHQMCSIELWATCSMHLREFQYRCTHTTVLCVCVWLTGLINRQRVGGGWTPLPQIIDTILAVNDASCSKKPGWWGAALKTDPPPPLSFYTAHTHTYTHTGSMGQSSVFSYTKVVLQPVLL